MPTKVLYCMVMLFLCLSQAAAGVDTAVRLRINTSHGLGNARGAVLDAGLKLDSEVLVTPSSSGNSPYLTPDQLIDDGKRVGATILSSSFSGWQTFYDSAFYSKLTMNGMVHVYAYVPSRPQPENAPPPAAFVTVNKIGGKTGNGIEFGVPAGYMRGKGQGTTPSEATAQLAGLMACLKYQHPDWNWFDVKAALRATASNYQTGYNSHTYGYGTIDYFSANALGNATTLPLFPPATVLLKHQNGILYFSVNSFLQSRRVADALFKFTLPPPPGTKELTLSEITALGGQLIVSGDYTATGNTARYRVITEETAYFIWFTKDAGGTYSRIEPYSVLGPVHLIPPTLAGPRIIR